MMHVSTLEYKVHYNYKPVAYEHVLKSRAYEIQSDINQLDNGEYISLSCHHRHVYSNDSAEIVIFVWASDRETHAMQTCIYEDMKRVGDNIMQLSQFSNFSFMCHVPLNLCNRSVEISGTFTRIPKLHLTMEIDSNTLHVKCMDGEIRDRIGVIGLSFHVSDPENDGVAVEGTTTEYNSNVSTVTSVMNIRSVSAAKSHMQTFVCSSIQLAWNNTGKLRQRFFSIVGESKEAMVRSFHAGSAHVTLDFDVLTFNASRPGLLNDSDVELLSLSDLRVSCTKLDQYGLNNEASEIIYTNMTEELSVTTKSLLISDKLQIRVNASVAVVSDNSFGEYSCLTYCNLKKENNETIQGCIQTKNFSIILDKWRIENLLYRIAHQDLVHTVYSSIDSRNILAFDYIQAKLEIDSLQKLSSRLAVFVVLFGFPVSIMVMKEIVKYVKRRKRITDSLKAFNSLESVLQLTEHSDNRNLKYDVFLSYSSKDRLWVESTLLKFIESKGFKVCFDERDFPIGCNLVETIAEAVYESRKVIAVVSPDYLSSRWCAQYEFVLTYTKILNKKAPSNSLLLIKYKDCQMPEHMNCLKYLDYIKMTNVKCSFAKNIFSFLFSFNKATDESETEHHQQFFNDLLSWLKKDR